MRQAICSAKKPKKDSSERIQHQDYVCTDYEKIIVEEVKKIPLSEEKIIVQIGNNDALIDRYFMDCLFQKSGTKAYMNDEVVNAYISLIRAEEHLQSRTDGMVYLETTFISAILKRDGKTQIDETDKNENSSMKRRVSTYTSHDMVFLPINIDKVHWYLAVINANKREIQILDSTGPKGRKELINTIEGLQKQINIVSQTSDVAYDKWPDIQVASWPYREIFNGEMQTDDCSCGLFMLNYIEYWQGNELSDIFDQDDMSQFRTKLAAILVTTELNKFSVCKSESRTECVTDEKKRKECPSQDDRESKRSNAAGNEEELIDGLTPEMILQIIEGEGEPVEIPSTEEMVDIVCDMIMMINDAAMLQTKWVRSYSPFQITISLKEVQDFLRMDQHMPRDFFNMGVRMLASADHKNLKETKQKNLKHYMDLRFCIMCQDSVKPQELSKTLTSWPPLYYDIKFCRYILLPYETAGKYILFVLDQEKKAMMIFDPNPIDNWCKDMPYKRFVKRIIFISSRFVPAMKLVQKGWYGDLFLWRHIPMEKTPILDAKGCLSGDMVLQIMYKFKGMQVLEKICTDGQKLRKRFVVDLLTYDGNKCKFLMPANIRAYLGQITGKIISSDPTSLI